ncbi:hypothetical protein PROFUN_00793 [Planoprotostelium fungivorum]|uniref:Uncharacterized protein n=1 Tax=Planoprotostelium fungivorum TaxID=1890364 RepID=A0A2P6P030_9EUKA|nr:hypothetical protein PROFUN_00793 [Planoprotostelium fungivorum]
MKIFFLFALVIGVQSLYLSQDYTANITATYRNIGPFGSIRSWQGLVKNDWTHQRKFFKGEIKAGVLWYTVDQNVTEIANYYKTESYVFNDTHCDLAFPFSKFIHAPFSWLEDPDIAESTNTTKCPGTNSAKYYELVSPTFQLCLDSEGLPTYLHRIQYRVEYNIHFSSFSFGAGDDEDYRIPKICKRAAPPVVREKE